MSRDLFRVTVDEPNYSNLLGDGPLDDDRRDLLTEEIVRADDVRLWAINTDSPASDTYHDYMNPNDGLLFYKVKRNLAVDEKMYVGVGVIGEKFETDADTAEQLFNTPTAKLMFTVENFSPISKRVEDIEPILEYERHPRLTQRVTKDRYGTVKSVLNHLRN